jgi:hypothetical protein
MEVLSSPQNFTYTPSQRPKLEHHDNLISKALKNKTKDNLKSDLRHEISILSQTNDYILPESFNETTRYPTLPNPRPTQGFCQGTHFRQINEILDLVDEIPVSSFPKKSLLRQK